MFDNKWLSKSRELEEQSKADARSRDSRDGEMRSHEMEGRHQKFTEDSTEEEDNSYINTLYLIAFVLLSLAIYNYDIIIQDFKEKPKYLRNITPYYEMVRDYFAG